MTHRIGMSHPGCIGKRDMHTLVRGFVFPNVGAGRRGRGSLGGARRGLGWLNGWARHESDVWPHRLDGVRGGIALL